MFGGRQREGMCHLSPKVYFSIKWRIAESVYETSPGKKRVRIFPCQPQLRAENYP